MRYKRLQQALDRADAFPQVQADALRSLGMAAADPDEAQSCYQQALHIHRKIGDQRGEWATIFNLSVLFMERGAVHTGRRLRRGRVAHLPLDR